MNDFLCDLVQELDKTYRGIRLVHSSGGVYLDDLGHGGFEHFSSISAEVVLTEPLVWKMRTELPDAHLVVLLITCPEGRENVEVPEVYLEAGDKGDELRISVILGKLKEMYS